MAARAARAGGTLRLLGQGYTPVSSCAPEVPGASETPGVIFSAPLSSWVVWDRGHGIQLRYLVKVGLDFIINNSRNRRKVCVTAEGVGRNPC